MLIIGLDGEMSGANFTDGHVLIQAGAAAFTQNDNIDIFCQNLRTPEPRSTTWWSERAAKIHGLTIDQVNAADSAEVVDDRLYAWMLAHGAKEGIREVLTVGFNVVAFDHVFFRSALPKTMSVVSRRGIDLNAACMLLDGWNPNSTTQTRDWLSWKRESKRFANKELERRGVVTNEHDAGFDAAQALLVFKFLQNQVHTFHHPVRPAPVGLPTGLRGKLHAVCSAQELAELDMLFANANLNAGSWLASFRPEFNTTGIQALLSGHFDKVLHVLKNVK